MTLVISPSLLAEFGEIIVRAKFAAIMARSNTNPERILTELRRLAEIVDPPPQPAPISRDADDDAVLALAVAARGDLIVSGDDDLLVLGSHGGIPIINPAQAVDIVEG